METPVLSADLAVRTFFYAFRETDRASDLYIR